MTADDFRRIALSLPEAEEKSHFGKPDFRVRNRIFATLPPGAHAVLKLTPEEQAMLAGAEPETFQPVKGGWGRQGWTEMDLTAADDATLRSACLMAWRNTAPSSLRKRLAASGGQA
ncbi:MmcQ/YjbR family DNA-binding protein [Mesorhizobium sp. LHD-90]|uniref:MmcQ/YjbR family DNA-binding protein n=1 Tax=Mesorhizobium sp. LHD-90 TaxID=3071414 RepID=UPI0027DF0DB8|nr:MmcQ/YjbR family DNA-binding protein [Mesorhizobium sp. LHD-90]MDQ6432724.1 MmcQ/YjbR family DNA-binding protein [Mesorhizobium sp. LHD-90]